MAGVTHVIEHRAVQYRRTFRSSVFTSFLTPLLFLTAMGIGLGGYVNASSTAALGGVSYLQFLAPGLLVATSMQSAAFEATFPIIGGLNWQRTFHAMYATPLSPRDIAYGNLLWTAFRLTLIATVFTIIVVLMGAAYSPAIVLGIPIAVLTGMSFAAPIAAFSATQRTPGQVQRHLPIHHHAAVPVLGRVLPDRHAAELPPGGRLAVAALARRGPDAGARARDDRTCHRPWRSSTSRSSSRSSRSGRGRRLG